MGTTFTTYSTKEGTKKTYKTERQILKEKIAEQQRRVQTYLLVFRFIKKIDGLKLGDKGREKAYKIAEQMGLNFCFRGWCNNYDSLNYIETKERTFKNWNTWFNPEANLNVNIGYGTKAIKINYQEICDKQFYKCVTNLRKSISAMQSALRTNKPEEIDTMEEEVIELQEQIKKLKRSARGN